MAAHPVSEDVLRQAVDAVARYGTQVQAAKMLGLSRTTIQGRIRDAERKNIRPTEAEFEVAALPDDMPPVKDLVKRRKSQYEQLHQSRVARKLIDVKIKLDGPIAIAHFGDPHVDDDGCDISKLEEDMQTVKKTQGMFGANVGDLQNNWVGRIAHLWAQQSTSAKEAWALVEWMVGYLNWIYLVGGNHDCLDLKTEALTKRGWMRQSEIRDDDEVLSINPQGNAVWSPIIQKIFRANDEPMVRIESRTVDLCATPNHRVLSKKRNWKREWSNWEYGRADSLPPRFMLPVSGGKSGAGAPLSDDEIRLAGWILTDGGIEWNGNSPRVRVYQSKPAPDLDRIFAALDLHPTVSVRERQIESVCGRHLVKTPLPQREYRLSAEQSRRVLAFIPAKGALPEWWTALDDRQFDVLLDALVVGDGCWDGARPDEKNCAVLHGTHQFLSSVQAAAVSHGWQAFLSVARGKDCRLNLCRKAEWQGERGEVVATEEAAPFVWCLRVPLGNFMIRRNGKAHFTGNCWSGNGDPLTWMMAQQPGVFGYNGTRLNLVFPNGKQVRINARHDFAGHSMWNPAHGPMKAVQGGWRDHILTCGHKHTSFIAGPLKDPASGLLSWAIRAAGYKIHDRYADEKGLPDQNAFSSCVTIIDPRFEDDDPRLVTVIADVQEGAEYLRWKRGRKAA